MDVITSQLKQYELSPSAALQNQIIKDVLLYSLWIVVAALMRGVFLFGVRQAIIVTSRHIEYDQKNQLFDAFQRMEASRLKQYHTGDLMARIAEDVAQVRMFTGPGIMYSMNSFSLFFMVLMVMLYVNAELTFYVLLPLPLLSYAIYAVHSRMIARSEQVQQQLASVSTIVQESFSGIRTLRAYNQEHTFAHRFANQIQDLKAKTLSLARMEAFFMPVIMLLIGLSTILAVYVGGLQMMEGKVTIGNIAEFIMYVTLMTWPIASLGWVTSLTQKAIASQKRINEILDLKPLIHYGNESLPNKPVDIVLQNVSFKYEDTGIQALENVNMHIVAGQCVAIIGKTGAGKSSLFALLTRLYDPNEGTISFHNIPLPHLSEQALKNHLAIVPQDTFLFSDSIYNNLRLSCPEASEEEIMEAAKFAHVHEEILSFPQGYQTLIGERGVTLSGGQKQRIALARAYLKKAPLLLLDDCFSAIDTLTETAIIQHLQNQSHYKPTLVMATHRFSILPYMHQVFFFQNGKLTAHGTHQELLANNAAYQEFFALHTTDSETNGLL